MKISYDWLKEYIEINESAEKIGELLTGSGLEVETLESFSTSNGSLEGLVIGEVLSCEKHPDADKLSLTSVNIGGETVPIVCGAPNVAKGQKVIVATIGTILTTSSGESFKIKKSKIRGQVSEGMICAEDEIGIGESHDGIMVLNTELANGTPAKEYLEIFEDEIFEIGLTPNRADAASHLGVARDLKVLLGKPINIPEIALKFPTENVSGFEIVIENEKACPRYAGVVISGVEVKESPAWLKNRLLSIGLSPINNIVDITNYVLHGYGQPMHAFDADKITSKKVRIGMVEKSTTFKTLDEVERKLNDFDLMICDDQSPMCIAGVFGGFDSGVSETTTSIFLESAYFSPEFIRKTAQSHGLKTDASFRFERGVDPEMTIKAIKIATKLILELAGGEIMSPILEKYPLPQSAFDVEVDIDRINALIGTQLTKAAIIKTLEGLEIKITKETGAKLILQVPAYRVDVQREADIAEEVLRIYGYDNIPLTNRLSTNFAAPSNEVDRKENLKRTIGHLLSANSFNEIFTNSLTKPNYTENLDSIDQEKYVHILNKLSEELGVMRQTNLFTGLEVISHNVNRKNSNLRFFEFGKNYYKKKDKYTEEEKLSLFMTGNLADENWQAATKKTVFHDLLNTVLLILEKCGIHEIEKKMVRNDFYDAGLELIAQNKTIASIGLIKKSVAKKLELNQSVLFADLSFEIIFAQRNEALVYEEISKFPPVRRDLSLVIDKRISFKDVEERAKKVNRQLIKEVNVFDVFEGEQIGGDKKSYSVSFILQDQNKTLNDKLIDKTMNKLIQVFENELDAVIRK